MKTIPSSYLSPIFQSDVINMIFFKAMVVPSIIHSFLSKTSDLCKIQERQKKNSEKAERGYILKLQTLEFCTINTIYILVPN